MNAEPLFVPEQLYHRKRELHAQFGGQEQGGMITPVKYELVFLVTGSSGRQHGYEDHWSEDGQTFFYFGEGQLGNMKFTKGNLALRDHVTAGEDVHLFEEVPGRSGYLRYHGQMVCAGWQWVEAPDKGRNLRKAILFELVPLESFDIQPSNAEQKGIEKESIEELRQEAMLDSVDSRTPIERRAIVRIRSKAVRAYVLRRATGKCEGCGQLAPFTTVSGEPYLEPHHIRRLTDGGPDDPRWVVGVCPNCHRRAHYSRDASAYNKQLAKVVEQLEAVYSTEDFLQVRQ